MTTKLFDNKSDVLITNPTGSDMLGKNAQYQNRRTNVCTQQRKYQQWIFSQFGVKGQKTNIEQGAKKKRPLTRKNKSVSTATLIFTYPFFFSLIYNRITYQIHIFGFCLWNCNLASTSSHIDGVGLSFGQLYCIFLFSPHSSCIDRRN